MFTTWIAFTLAMSVVDQWEFVGGNVAPIQTNLTVIHRYEENHTQDDVYVWPYTVNWSQYRMVTSWCEDPNFDPSPNTAAWPDWLTPLGDSSVPTSSHGPTASGDEPDIIAPNYIFMHWSVVNRKSGEQWWCYFASGRDVCYASRTGIKNHKVGYDLYVNEPID